MIIVVINNAYNPNVYMSVFNAFFFFLARRLSYICVLKAPNAVVSVKLPAFIQLFDSFHIGKVVMVHTVA